MSISLKHFGAAGLASIFLTASTGAFAQARKKPAQPAHTQPAPAQPAQSQAAPQRSRAAPRSGQARLWFRPKTTGPRSAAGSDGQQGNLLRRFAISARKQGSHRSWRWPSTKSRATIRASFACLCQLASCCARASVLPSTRAQTQEGTFEICFPNGCFAEAKVKGADDRPAQEGVDSERRGQESGE